MLRLKAADHWFDNEADNRLQGFGKGAAGRLEAATAFTNMLRMNDNDEVPAILRGVYLDTEPVGYFFARDLGKGFKTAEMHMYVEPPARRVGVAPTAVIRFLEELYEAGAHRVEAPVLAINKRAISALRKGGFKQEGRKAEAWWMDNQPYDMVLMRMLKRQFLSEEKRKAA